MKQLTTFYPLYFARTSNEFAFQFGTDQEPSNNHDFYYPINPVPDHSIRQIKISEPPRKMPRIESPSAVATLNQLLKGQHLSHADDEADLDNILDEILNSSHMHMNFSLDCSFLDQLDEEYNTREHATVYSQPPSLWTRKCLSAVPIQKRNIADALFLTLARYNTNEPTGSFIIHYGPSRKRKNHDISKNYIQGDLMKDYSMLEGVQDNAKEAVNNLFELQMRLNNTQAQLKALQEQQCLQQQQNIDEICTFLMSYFPNHQNNYSQLLPPIKYNLIDSANRVGNYNIGKCLGEGGFAQVFHCTFRASHQHYAMKKLDKSNLLSEFALTSLSNELRVLQHAHHPNIITAKEFLNGKTHVYIIMELGHSTLYDYCLIHAGKLNTAVHREIALGIFRGLEYLHSIGIAHLDLKLENILVKSHVSPFHIMPKHILLADFGLCAIGDGNLEPIHVEGTLGTPGFYAPEMKLNGFSHGRQADMWSAGVTLLEMVEGLPIGWMEAYQQDDEDCFRAALEDCLLSVANPTYFSNSSARELVLNLLNWMPENRLTSQEVLMHNFLNRHYKYAVNESNDCRKHCPYGNL